MNLEIEKLDGLEAPLTDMEWGMLAGLAGLAGYALGAAVFT